VKEDGIAATTSKKQREATTKRKEKQEKKIDVEGIRTLARLPGTA
jgi:hypothetical protein